MAEIIAEVVGRWDSEKHSPLERDLLFSEILLRLEFLERTHYHQYVPTLGPQHQEFEKRLEKWLDNVSDEADRRLLFEYVPHITFFTREDFLQLHQAALRGPITRWIIDELDLQLDDPDLDDKINTEIHRHTWFCPISDSMQIADFHRTNGIGGVDFRPDWRSLEKFGDPQQKRSELLKFMQRQRLRRIVLLEDFIGSGAQLRNPDVIGFAGSLNVAVLLVPLIICPEGCDNIRATLQTEKYNKHNRVRFEPVLSLKPDQFVNSKSSPRDDLERGIQELVRKTYDTDVVGDGAASPRPYEAFGLRNTGAQVVMYSNTPANTLPIIHHESNTWNPLFRRSARIK